MQQSLAHPTAERTDEIGRTVIGPVVQRWMLGLHQYLHYLAPREPQVLMLARAGVRIQRFYKAFAAGQPGGEALPSHILWISRFAVAKGTFARDPRAAAELIAREYHDRTVADLIRGVARHRPDVLEPLDLAADHCALPAGNFRAWLAEDTPQAGAIRVYLDEVSGSFERYLTARLDGRDLAVLVDTGWQGTVQRLLEGAFPQTEWLGLYYGRSFLAGTDRRVADRAVGLMFEADEVDLERPETAVIAHRHLIEALVEPAGPSIEEIPEGAGKTAAMTLIAANEADAIDPVVEPLAAAVERYLADHRGQRPGAIVAAYEQAMATLQRMILFPTADDARALGVKDRSADFGKATVVPVLTDPCAPRAADGADTAATPTPATTPSTAADRVREALWPQGQIALEFTGRRARDLQERALAVKDAARYFDPASENRATKTDPAEQVATPSVAVITRTKDRPILFRRAAQSVARQTFENLIWVVVNDGGDPVEVRREIARSAVDRRRIRLVSHAESQGMEAASNAGIAAAKSDYIVIHDDDDSWDPTFLARTVAFLSGPGGRRYGGVITHATYVSEEIDGDRIVEVAHKPYQAWVRNVQLSEMIAQNIFPPIAFVFRRSAWEAVGGYNEALPVLGDWYFNLEFLLRADIGVIPEPLAFYHHRDTGKTGIDGVYTNSVIGGVSKHEEFAAVARNTFIREHGLTDPGGMAAVLGFVLEEVRRQSHGLRRHMDETRKMLQLATETPNLDAEIDEMDRLWAIATINKRAAEERRRAFRTSKAAVPTALEPTAGWAAVSQALVMFDISVPKPSNFSDVHYLSANADVAVAYESGEAAFAEPFDHYLRYGRQEGRTRGTI